MSDAGAQLLGLRAEGHTLRVHVAADQLTAVRTCDQLDSQLGALLSSRTERDWVVDFRGVTFLVSPAVTTLLKVMKALRSKGGKLILTGFNDNIRHIFELMRLDQVLLIADDDAHAAKLLQDK